MHLPNDFEDIHGSGELKSAFFVDDPIFCCWVSQISQALKHNIYIYMHIYSAAGNLQLYLPMRVVRFACQPQLPFRTIAAAMIYTGESCDDLLQASQTNWCRRLRHAANLVGFCSPFLTDF